MIHNLPSSKVFQNKISFKQGELARSHNAGFVGIGSEFGYFTGWGDF